MESSPPPSLMKAFSTVLSYSTHAQLIKDMVFLGRLQNSSLRNCEASYRDRLLMLGLLPLVCS